MAVGVKFDDLGPVAEEPPAQKQVREVDVGHVHQEVEDLACEVLQKDRKRLMMVVFTVNVAKPVVCLISIKIAENGRKTLSS